MFLAYLSCHFSVHRYSLLSPGCNNNNGKAAQIKSTATNINTPPSVTRVFVTLRAMVSVVSWIEVGVGR